MNWGSAPRAGRAWIAGCVTGIFFAACGGGDSVGPDSGADADAGAVDAPAADAADAASEADGGVLCDPSKTFGTGHPIAELNSSEEDVGLSLSADELDGVFASTRTVDGGSGGFYLYEATRADAGATFSTQLLFSAADPALSSDGLTLYALQYDGPGALSIYTRPSHVSAFVQSATALSAEYSPFLSADGKTLYVSEVVGDGSARQDIVSYDTATFGARRTYPGISTWAGEVSPVVSPDGLTMYFARVEASADIYVATRASTNDDFGSVTQVTELDTPADEFPSWISPDLCRLYYTHYASAKRDLYVAKR
jgi:hypothetical protein